MPDVGEGAVWAIFFLPLASFAVIALFLRRLPILAGLLTILCIGAALVLALLTLSTVIDADGARIGFPSHEWLRFHDFEFRIGLRVDGLTAVMLVVVTAVSFLVQVYSTGYMAGDPGYGRYFMSMSLFTASMLGLVLADSILMVFVFWELVGLCSYLLIGFWFQRPAAAAAAKKAFVVTRFGDLGFLAAVVFMFTQLQSFDIDAIQEAAQMGALSSTAITWFALGVFAGAAGKSAQFPLHVWLPDAMEGPTPVSALIHAATMVAAGVYLIARMFPVFEASQGALNTVAALGAVTALLAATMGLVMNDIKRVMAYSTISQLGYMVMSLGVGAYAAAIFHLMNHAFFKALLFLGAGSVNHATGTFDMRLMGGLRRVMPFTYLGVVFGGLSLAGIFPFSGFWSKDEILLDAWDDQKAVFWVGLSAAFFTAFYVSRMIFMTFHGEYRGGSAAEHGATAAHGSPHESPWVMVLPLLILAAPSLGSGLLNLGGGVTDLLNGALPEELRHEAPDINLGIAAAATVVALAGIFFAYLVYQARVISPQALGAAFRPAYLLVANKYYLNTLYEQVLVRRLFYGGVCRTLSAFDAYVVDGVVNGVGWVVSRAGDGLRRAPNGQLQGYGTAGIVVLLLMLGIYLAAKA